MDRFDKLDEFARLDGIGAASAKGDAADMRAGGELARDQFGDRTKNVKRCLRVYT